MGKMTKHDDMEPINIGLHFEVQGYYRLEKAKVDANGDEIPGTREVAADWFPNLILDNGLDLMGNSNFLNACQTGSGSATPVVTDTILQNRIAGSTTIQADSYGTNNTVTPYYGWRRKTYRFLAGVTTGNVSELGIGPATTGPVMSRALVLDSGGNPTTITILSDEVLDVIYEFRLYVPMTDNTGSITLTTEGSTHTWVAGAIDVEAAQNTSWDYNLGNAFAFSSAGAYYTGGVFESNVRLALTASGTSSGSFSLTHTAYVNGTRYRSCQLFLDLNNGNFATGLGSFQASGTFGAYQFTFSPKIAKVATKKLTINFRISWARKVL